MGISGQCPRDLQHEGALPGKQASCLTCVSTSQPVMFLRSPG